MKYLRTLMILVFLLLSIVPSAQLNYKDSLNVMFGHACGIGGSALPYMLRTVKLVNNSDKSKLLAMLVSANPQDKIHGYVGLYFFKRNGNKLDDSVLQQMKRVKKSDEIVTYCRSCFYGLHAAMKELLKRKRLQTYYNWYKFTGHDRYR